MSKRVKIRTLVALAGTEFSLAAGDEWEVDEAVAKARVEAGLAEYVEASAARGRAQRGGASAETAVDEEREKR